jgi:hypothetical protein
VIFTAASVGLIGFLVWLVLFHVSVPMARVVFLPIRGYDPIVPAVAFLPAEELDGFDAAPPTPKMTATVLRELVDSEHIGDLGDRLNGIVASPKDRLILFVSAQGVSEKGVPYVLCSNFGRTRTPENTVQARRELSRLLDDVSRCQAETKLVLLDCSHLSGDPRWGMAVNEFAQRIQETVKGKDSSVWVLASNRPLELSRVSYATKRTYFAHYAMEALRGQADANGDHFVDLREFYEFVRDGVATAVKNDGERDERQTPVLFHGGEGEVREPPARTLFVVPRENLKDKQKESEDATASEAIPGGKITLVADALPEAKPQPKAESKTAETPAGDPRSLLRKAWQRRDAMQARASGDWSPVDYAPHLWREYEETLLGFELRYRYGANWNAIQNETLRQLAGELPSPGTALLGRIEQAKATFLETGLPEQFDQAPDDLRFLKECVQLKNDLCYAAPHYVRWCARSRLLSPGLPLPAVKIGELLEKLREFSGLIERLEAGNRPADTPPEAAEQEMSAIREKRETLVKLRDELSQQFARLVTETKTKPQRSTSRIESLLSTPLADAATRMTLLDALMVRGEPPAYGEPVAEQPWGDAWRLLAEQADLEWRLLRLADPDVPEKPNLAQSLRSNSDAGSWERFQAFGDELKSFYYAAPDHVNRGLKPKEPAEARRARQLILAIDDHYAGIAIDSGVPAIVLPTVAWTQLQQRRLELDGGQTAEAPIKLRRDNQWTPLDVALRAIPRTAGEVAMQMKFNANLLEVRDAEGKLALGTQPVKFTLGQDGRRTLRVEVRAKDVARFTREEPLELDFRWENAPATRRVRCVMAAPDEIDLVVERVVERLGEDPIRVPQRFAAAGPRRPETVQAYAFPNRTTNFAFKLRNRSDQPRAVTVQLFAVAKPSGADRPTRLEPLDSFGQLRREFEAISDPIAMKLPATEEPQAIPFDAKDESAKPGEKSEKPEKKGPEKKEPEKKDEKPAAKKPAAEEKPQGKELAHGVACLIREPSSGKQWTRWVEFRPVPPSDYLDPKVDYSHTEHRITLKVKLRNDPRYLPPVSPEEPVTVEWDVVDQDDPTQRLTPARPLKLMQSGAEDSISVESFPDEDRKARIELDVDRWPRALLYDLECKRTGVPQPQGDLRQVAIRSPLAGTAFKSPFEAGKGLPVQFQVDAPHEAFVDPDAENFIEVWLDAERDRSAGQFRERFRFDRQASFRFEKVGGMGLVRVSSEVQDYKISLDTRRLSETPATIYARLELDPRKFLPRENDPRDRMEAKVPVLFDGEAPKFTLTAAREIAQGAPIRAAIQVEDLSGLQKVEWRIDRDASNRPLAEDGKFTEVPVPAGAKQLQFSVATKEIKQLVPGATFFLRVRAIDRVGLFEDRTSSFKVLEPELAPGSPGMPGKPAAPQFGTIRGQVYYKTHGRQDVDWNELTVTLEGPDGQHVVKGDLKGTFTVSKLPYGQYKISVSGTTDERGYRGSTQVKLDRPSVPAEIVANK